jgi:hypothetical protein
MPRTMVGSCTVGQDVSNDGEERIGRWGHGLDCGASWNICTVASEMRVSGPRKAALGSTLGHGGRGVQPAKWIVA